MVGSVQFGTPFFSNHRVQIFAKLIILCRLKLIAPKLHAISWKPLFLKLKWLIVFVRPTFENSQHTCTTKLNFNIKLNDLENDLSVLNESDIHYKLVCNSAFVSVIVSHHKSYLTCVFEVFNYCFFVMFTVLLAPRAVGGKFVWNFSFSAFVSQYNVPVSW